MTGGIGNSGSAISTRDGIHFRSYSAIPGGLVVSPCQVTIDENTVIVIGGQRSTGASPSVYKLDLRSKSSSSSFFLIIQ